MTRSGNAAGEDTFKGQAALLTDKNRWEPGVYRLFIQDGTIKSIRVRPESEVATLKEVGLPEYPGLDYDSSFDHESRLPNYSFLSALKEKEGREVFEFYVQRLKASGWERDDHLDPPRHKSKDELGYALFVKNDKPLQMVSIHLLKGGETLSKDPKKEVTLHILFTGYRPKR